MNSKKTLLLAILLFSLAPAAGAAITVNINSGNPVKPFPQFLDYPGGATLASHLPPGVSHAEMEQWLRDAWKIHSNEFNYAGTAAYQNAAGGNVTVNLIKDSSSPYCSEGHGYALLSAALMCDKDAFDGLWFYLNENNYFNLYTKYSTGSVFNPAYAYGAYTPAWAGPGSDSATDGDEDIAMACLIAWKQWGDNTGYYAAGGTGPVNANGLPAIQYRQMALDMMHFMVQKSEGSVNGDSYYVTGDIGFDGYFKSGNTWPEVTSWASGQPGDQPDMAGPIQAYFDYTAPSYYRSFGYALAANGDPAWNYNQFFRAAESSNWLMGQLSASANKTIEAGNYSVNGATCTFANFNPGGEDFRAPLRSGLDYLWNGNPTDSWNPATHQIAAGGNTWMYDAMIKQANFLKNPQAQGVACVSYGSSPVTYQGIAALTEYNLNGSQYWSFHLNRFGASAPAFVASQDFDLMDQVFRELMIEWDVTGGTNSYLGSIPAYFHGFYRQIGLMILTGNWDNPAHTGAAANMKIYEAIDKTYASDGETVTYWINYRNFGSAGAAAVKIIDTLPPPLGFVSATSGGVYNAGNNTVTWNLGTVNGLQSQDYAATMGGVTLVAHVKNGIMTPARYFNRADISCANGTGWTTADSPNEITTIMKRNSVDIIPAALSITKTASVTTIAPGETLTYTIDYCNTSAPIWLNGGRPGINFSFAVKTLPGTADNTLDFFLRANHEAGEPVVDWGNYRISYYLNSTYAGAQWNFSMFQHTGFDFATASMVDEPFVSCFPAACTDNGRYFNQRLMIRFGSTGAMTAEPTHQLFYLYGMSNRIHMGNATEPFFMEGTLTASYNNQDWTDDWSQQVSQAVQGQGAPFLPVSPDWTKGDGTSTVVTRINASACQTTTETVQNILVEEWDGYAWRRVFGSGPAVGRTVQAVQVTDSLPANINFGGIVSLPAGAIYAYNAGSRTLGVAVANVDAGQYGQIKYWAIAGDPGCPAPDTAQTGIAWIYGNNEPARSSSDTVTLSCPVSSPTVTADASPVPSPSDTPFATPSATATGIGTETPAGTATETFTLTPTPAITGTCTPSATQTLAAGTPSFTATRTPNATGTFTPAPTQPATATVTPTQTAANTGTLITVMPFPQPFFPSAGFDLSLKVNIPQNYKKVFLRIYTPGFRLIKNLVLTDIAAVAGSRVFLVPLVQLSKLSAGIYYYQVEAVTDTNKSVKSKISMILILK